MRLASLRVVRGLAAAFALCALGASAGCDWLKSSGPGTRSSPFLSNLNVAPAGGVRCGPLNPFEISFRYSDLQGDILELVLRLVHPGGEEIEERVLWNDPRVNLQVAGLAKFEYAFACGSPGGVWKVLVTVVDLDGHESNELEGTISLNSL